MLCEPIGLLRTPFRSVADMPIQPTGARGVEGQVVLRPEFAEGLADLEGFSHIIVLYTFHRAREARLTVTPFLDTQSRGVFATRAPARPNPIGLSILRLQGVRGCELDVADIDVLDETPLLDIKPYVPAFDQPKGPVRTGWLSQTGRQVQTTRSDSRFDQQDQG